METIYLFCHSAYSSQVTVLGSLSSTGDVEKCDGNKILHAGSVESDKFLFFWKLLFLNMINSPKLLNNSLIIIFLTSWPHERDYSLLTAMQRNMTYEMLIFMGADKGWCEKSCWFLDVRN